MIQIPNSFSIRGVYFIEFISGSKGFNLKFIKEFNILLQLKKTVALGLFFRCRNYGFCKSTCIRGKDRSGYPASRLVLKNETGEE